MRFLYGNLMVRWGAEQPVTVHKKGLVLNCETTSWKVMRDVSYCTGVKVTRSCSSPPAGITPGGEWKWVGRESEHPSASQREAHPHMATKCCDIIRSILFFNSPSSH